MTFWGFLGILILANILVVTTVVAVYLARKYARERNRDKNVEKIVEKDISLAVEVLKMEFNYAKESSFKAESDRLTIVNIYISLYGIGIPLSIGFLQWDSNSMFATFLILLFLAILGIIFVLKIVRLRQAWHNSAVVMNKIKEYFINIDPEVGDFLLWRSETLPKVSRFKTISSLSAILVSLLGASAIFLFGFLLIANPLFSFLVALLYLVSSLALYHFMLVFGK